MNSLEQRSGGDEAASAIAPTLQPACGRANSPKNCSYDNRARTHGH